ncbi:hypothetical protein AVEN_179878-1 [Araneus ventricosus]|uniref:Uncharacterized protein n=1 Tax=Araneus ventricosus TaxID=182803 RepID=A0A4Y2WVY7_ARAVE|nr:hypothetical protein AVEN_179878-1 [Araneus ventricosus]
MINRRQEINSVISLKETNISRFVFKDSAKCPDRDATPIPISGTNHLRYELLPRGGFRRKQNPHTYLGLAVANKKDNPSFPNYLYLNPKTSCHKRCCSFKTSVGQEIYNI